MARVKITATLPSVALENRRMAARKRLEMAEPSMALSSKMDFAAISTCAAKQMVNRATETRRAAPQKIKSRAKARAILNAG
ncbi:hypothetical protein BraRD5C2_13140 [Bradyrhizobium sp. RD5-C2]|nr:hypothetical protein BraRD5C2_13140 [Bradyrhizobium sp. RD5-C2]